MIAVSFDKIVSPRSVTRIRRRMGMTVSGGVPVRIACPSESRLTRLRCEDGVRVRKRIEVIATPKCSIYTYYTPRIGHANRVNVLGIVGCRGCGKNIEVDVLYNFETLRTFERGYSVVSRLVKVFAAGRRTVISGIAGLGTMGRSLGSRLNAMGSTLLSCGITRLPTSASGTMLFRSNVSAGATEGYIGNLIRGCDNFDTFFAKGSRTNCDFVVKDGGTSYGAITTTLEGGLNTENNNGPIVIRNSIGTTGDRVRRILGRILWLFRGVIYKASWRRGDNFEALHPRATFVMGVVCGIGCLLSLLRVYVFSTSLVDSSQGSK